MSVALLREVIMLLSVQFGYGTLHRSNGHMLLEPADEKQKKKDSSLLAGLASRLQQDIATGNICSSGDRMSEKREESRDAIPSLRGDPMSAFRRDQMPQPMISSFVDVCLSCFLARVWQEAFGRLQR